MEELEALIEDIEELDARIDYILSSPWSEDMWRARLGAFRVDLRCLAQDVQALPLTAQ
jgi:hypothetical protein